MIAIRSPDVSSDDYLHNCGELYGNCDTGLSGFVQYPHLNGFGAAGDVLPGCSLLRRTDSASRPAVRWFAEALRTAHVPGESELVCRLPSCGLGIAHFRHKPGLLFGGEKFEVVQLRFEQQFGVAIVQISPG